MIHYILAIITGVLSGIIASTIYSFFLYRVKPKIEISDQISKRTKSNGEIIYTIKVINYTEMPIINTKMPIINVKAQLHLVDQFKIPEGTNRSFKEISLKTNEIMELSGFDLKDETAGYDFSFVSYKDIEKLWKDDARYFLRFTIYATHSFSGFSKVFYKEYKNKRSIKEGAFEFGNSLEIM